MALSTVAYCTEAAFYVNGLATTVAVARDAVVPNIIPLVYDTTLPLVILNFPSCAHLVIGSHAFVCFFVLHKILYYYDAHWRLLPCTMFLEIVVRTMTFISL